MTDIIKRIDKRVSEVQVRKSLKRANKDRQYSIPAINKYKAEISKMVDLASKIVDKQIPVPAGEGLKGSRGTPFHMTLAFSQIEAALLGILAGENFGDDEE